MKTRANNDLLMLGMGPMPSQILRKIACRTLVVIVGSKATFAERRSSLMSERTRLTRESPSHPEAGGSSRRIHSPGRWSLRNQTRHISATLATSMVFAVQMTVTVTGHTQSLPAQLPSVLTHETAAQVGAIRHIWLPRTETKPHRRALALPDGSYIEGSIETTIFKGDLEVEGGVYKASCEPATHSIARVSKSGTVLWAKSYFVKGKVITMCDRAFYGFEVRSGLYSSGQSSMYLMPDKKNFLIFLDSYQKDSPFVFLDVETGMPSTSVPVNIRIVDAEEVFLFKKKFIDDAFGRYHIPKDKEGHLFPKAIPELYKKLERQVFRRPPHVLPKKNDHDRVMR